MHVVHNSDETIKKYDIKLSNKQKYKLSCFFSSETKMKSKTMRLIKAVLTYMYTSCLIVNFINYFNARNPLE